MPSIKLTYFDIAGRAEAIRLAFKLQGIEFEDIRVKFQDWPAMKASMKYGAMPCLTVDGKEYFESLAILRYVARMTPGSKLYPQDPEGMFIVEEALSVVQDLEKRVEYAREISMRPQYFGYPADFSKTPEGQEFVKKARVNFVDTLLPGFLETFSKMINANGGLFLTGSDVTIADLFLYRQLKGLVGGVMDYIPTTCLDKCAPILSYIARIEDIPQIKAHYSK